MIITLRIETNLPIIIKAKTQKQIPLNNHLTLQSQVQSLLISLIEVTRIKICSQQVKSRL